VISSSAGAWGLHWLGDSGNTRDVKTMQERRAGLRGLEAVWVQKGADVWCVRRQLCGLCEGCIGQSERGSCRCAKAGCWVAWGGMNCERCAVWRGVRDSVLLRRGALSSLGEVAEGCRGKVLGAFWNGISAGAEGSC
jgi:hypothetical protein